MKTPLKVRFPEYYQREDILQEYESIAAKCERASPNAIKRMARENWQHHWKKLPGGAESSLTRDQLIDVVNWNCFTENTGGEDLAILNHDIKKAITHACDVYPRPVVLAACDLMTVTEASIACRARKETICEQVGRAKDLLRELLRDYQEEQAD